ncbi:type IV secretory system conjugative DNA transfer family protein [Bradyrhizobium genosp. A]|uniref:type IV secretory system conjugative DNA transfer family protein n=1 Tax=Bradyrhizobium genosp. A TaxID=83626 RepID=UPI003CF24AEF
MAGGDDDAKGIVLGRHYDDTAQRAGDKIAYGGERHLLMFGPNGTGKGTRFLIPNLLSIEDRSVIVIDPKGELAAVTADYRRTIGDVILLNPFNVLGLGSAGFNPLAALDPKSPTFYDDAAALGEALIKLEGKDPHWTESAQGLIVALIMWEKLKKGDAANLENVRALLTAPDRFERYTEDGKLMERLVEGLRYTATQMVADGGYEIASLVGRFSGRDTNEMASVRSTADTQTRWLLSKPMRDDLRKNGVDFRGLKDKPTTVYVILPAERMRTHSTWLRLVVVSALRSLYRAGGLRTLLMIDEMPALGHLGPLEDAFGLVRGYKVQIAGICQDLAQLKALYKERWESFLANAGVVQGFAPNDLTTADWMSRRAGQTTLIAANTSESLTPETGRKSESMSWNQVGRALYLPHQLMGFTEGTGLFFLAGMENTTRFFAPPYWKIDQCAKRAKHNPYYEV